MLRSHPPCSPSRARVSRFHYPQKHAWSSLFAALFLLATPLASSDQVYKFERLWPTLQQPWYFNNPLDVTVDPAGLVYIADTGNNRVRKFTTDGIFISEWGGLGTGNGQLNAPYATAIDDVGNVYVADAGNSRIQKFTPGGAYLLQWGSFGTAIGQFHGPSDLAIGPNGHVYVADYYNNNIQEFTSTGGHVRSWGVTGTGNGQLDRPAGLAIDAAGNVYVSDSGNNRIQKFSSAGVFILKWGSLGTVDGQFAAPAGLMIDGDNNVYVADKDNGRIQKFTAAGVYLGQFGQFGLGDGQLNGPSGLAKDASDNIYVADTYNGRIQKFTHAGLYSTQWSSYGSGPGQFIAPSGVALDSTGNVYVADINNNRIQKFTAAGAFESQWGEYGVGDGQLNGAFDVALDGNDNVYVVDSYNSRIQKFTSTGTYVTQWGGLGTGNGQMDSPTSVAVDQSNNVYVADANNHRIQKFTSTGDFVTQWGGLGTGNGQFNSPQGIATDDLGNVYVSDSENHRIQKFTSTGTYVTQWGTFGSATGELNYPTGLTVDNAGKLFVVDGGNNRIQIFTLEGAFTATFAAQGSGPGQCSLPRGIAVDETGNVYLADTANNRVEKFRPVTVSSAAKAIIVAAGGPFAGNNLWDTTQACANFAYRTLTYQGFTKETIRYLSSDVSLDLDGNGIADDIAGDSTNANLQAAITQWALDADDLVVYLVDHGGDQTFRMSGTETLRATDLASWLDTAQARKNPTKVVVIYDACESGSFVPALSHPGRIVITSASAGENAYFLSTGTISFSSFFWTYVFNGSSVQQSFDAAVAAIGQSIVLQNPQIADPDTLASTTFIGNGTQLEGDAPVIGDVSPAQVISATSTAELVADPVTDADGIARVWAVIQPPDYVQSLDNPVQSLPSLELVPDAQNSPRWSGTYDGFTSEGTYTIAIYAADRQTNTSTPKITSVSVNSPRARRAIIVGGGADTDPLWPAIENSSLVAYNALRGQGYTDDTIRFYAPVTFNPGVDGLNALANLQSALVDWATVDTQDVVLYLCGNACANSFALNATENVSASQLDTWLDQVQSAIPGKVVVVIDASNAGQFVPSLLPAQGKSRIVITGAGVGEAASFASDGDVSFSNYFWRHVLNGATVEQAFRLSSTAIRFSAKGQAAQLDDNGNGIANEKADGTIARNYRIGSGIQLAGDDPLIDSVSPAAYLDSNVTTSPLFADNVTTTGTLNRVWAEITPPNVGAKGACTLNLVSIDLVLAKDGRYEADFDGVTQDGTYTVAVFAQDAKGNIATPSITHIKRGADAFADIDNNDANDAADVQLVINAALDIPIEFTADVDQNSAVNAVDVQLVINAALGL